MVEELKRISLVERCLPMRIQCDNGTEFISKEVKCYFVLVSPSVYPEIVKWTFEGADYVNVPEELIQRFASNTSISVRELEGLCISYITQEYLAGRH